MVRYASISYEDYIRIRPEEYGFSPSCNIVINDIEKLDFSPYDIGLIEVNYSNNSYIKKIKGDYDFKDNLEAKTAEKETNKKSPKISKIEASIREPLEKYLQEEYVKKCKTQRELGKKLGAAQTTIGKWLKLFDIEARKRGGPKKTLERKVY